MGNGLNRSNQGFIRNHFRDNSDEELSLRLREDQSTNISPEDIKAWRAAQGYLRGPEQLKRYATNPWTIVGAAGLAAASALLYFSADKFDPAKPIPTGSTIDQLVDEPLPSTSIEPRLESKPDPFQTAKQAGETERREFIKSIVDEMDLPEYVTDVQYLNEEEYREYREQPRNHNIKLKEFWMNAKTNNPQNPWKPELQTTTILISPETFDKSEITTKAEFMSVFNHEKKHADDYYWGLDGEHYSDVGSKAGLRVTRDGVLAMTNLQELSAYCDQMSEDSFRLTSLEFKKAIAGKYLRDYIQFMTSVASEEAKNQYGLKYFNPWVVNHISFMSVEGKVYTRKFNPEEGVEYTSNQNTVRPPKEAQTIFREYLKSIITNL